MKKVFLLLAVCFFYVNFNFGQAHSNSFNLPVKVESAFHKDFKGAKIYSVENAKRNTELYYKIETIISRKINKVTYNRNGKIIIIEKEIALNMVPSKIIKKLKMAFPGTEILVAQKIIKNKKISYKLNTTQNGEEHTVQISDKGKILSRIHIFEKVEEGC